MCSPQWIHVAWLEQRCDANPSSCNAHLLRMDHQLLSPFISPSPSFPSTICKMDSQWNLLYDSGNLHWGCVTIYRVGRTFKKKRTYIYLCLNHADVWQKQHTLIKQLSFSLKKMKRRNSNQYPRNTKTHKTILQLYHITVIWYTVIWYNCSICSL